MEINKKKIKENLEKNKYLFEDCTKSSLQNLKRYLPYFDRDIAKKEKEIQELLYVIELLKQEKETRIKKIEEIENEERQIVIKISENKKIHSWDKYNVYLTLEEVTHGNELIKQIDAKILSFKERVSVRNTHLLNWINSHDVKEIYTNMDISKFIKEFNVNDIKIITK